jgi:translocation and assembly module TamB
VGDVTAGIQVLWHATSPQAEVWADPAMDESEALAYLVLGRPLSSASSDEGRQLDAASAACRRVVVARLATCDAPGLSTMPA